jgi:hypothetical protein
VSGGGKMTKTNQAGGAGTGDGGGSGGRWLDDAAAPGAQALRRALDEAGQDDDTAFSKQRVWNRVQMPWAGQSPLAPAPRTRWIPLLALGAIALCATGALVGSRFLDLRAPTAVAPAGSESSSPAGADVVTLPPPATIALTTGPDELARHRLARGVAVELAERSALIPGDETTPPEVKVGKVRFSVPHQAPGRRYLVRAGAYQVVVIGTTFDVAVDDAGVAVAVTTGVVAVEDAASGRQLSRLVPGMRWSSGTRDEAVGPHRPAGASSSPSRRAARGRLARAAAPAAKAKADPVTARAFDDADAARAKDPQAAIARYQRLVDLGGPMAEMALYEIGVVQAEDLHDQPAALQTWQRHRAQYPAGLLRAEGDLSIFEALARTGKVGPALDEARGFLAHHPGSERRAEVARAAGDLARTRGDCRTAIGFYDLAAQLRSDLPDVDDAAFHRAACLRALADARATATARDYLTRFPFGRHAAAAQRLLAGGKVDPQGE